VRKTLIIIFCFLSISCEFDFQIDKKITVDEFINEELKSLNWNDVDQYPVFENCLEINNVKNKNNCFVETITNSFRENLKTNNLVLNRTLIDTVRMVLKVDKIGKISIENMTISDQNNKYKEVITKSFENTVSSLPKLYPAIKRGQEVDVIFNIPIIISTEN
jgi:hypothetical protein|tara:strand:- start:2516 stop:3001 length:486 start_codon:yes stop_codon:yes gene_type:complete